MQVRLDVWWLRDRDDLGSFELVSTGRAVTQLPGVLTENLLGQRMDAAFPHLLQTDLPRQCREVVLSGEARDVGELRGSFGPSGDEGLCSVKIFPLPGDRVGVAFENVTERQRAGQALIESEGHFRFLDDLTEATRTIADPEQIMAVMARMLGERLRVSRCAYADVEDDGERFTILHDYTDGCASTVGSYLLSLFGPRAVATLNRGEPLVIRNVHAELLPGEGAEMFRAIGIQAIITYPLLKDGVLRAMMAVHQVTPRAWTPGEVAVVQDVVERCWATIERRTAEARLRQSEALLRIAGRTAHLGAWAVELPSLRVVWSDELCAILETPPGFAPGLEQALDVYVPTSRALVSRAFDACAQQGTAFDLELEVVTATGRHVNVRCTGEARRNGTGAITGVHGAFQDITERQAAAEEYRLLFDSNPHAMWVFDLETLAFLAVNDAALQLYGFSRAEFLGMTIKDIRPPAEVPGLLASLPLMSDARSLPATHVLHRKKDGSLLEVEGFSNPIVFRGRRARLVLAHDVSAKRLLEKQLLQSQKMEAVGRLAGGVAHDFNNTLGVILGYTELLLRQAGEAQRGKLEQILKATQHASGLTRQLLAFSRKQIVDPKVLDLNTLVTDLEQMLRRLIGEDVDLTIVPGTQLGQVKADGVQLEQVLMNLCVNARDAMPNGGLLRIETANAELDAGHAMAAEPMVPGRYVMLAVSDAGCGIELENLPKIFEPFFTTKELGKGTGLGLAMAYGIVRQAGGYVAVDSELGRGTTFKIYLPRVDEPPTVEVVETPLDSEGWETVLLVEDEVSLRGIAREILEEHGYRVIEAPDGNAALELAARHAEPIQLLLTDVVMPGMHGRALAEALLLVRPELKVLYMSGYTDDVIAHRGVLEPGTLLVTKPFTARTLLARVREALGESSVGASA